VTAAGYPTNFSALAIAAGTGLVTFGNTSIGSVTSVVNPVTLAAGQTVATVTNPVALPVIPTNWITATGVAAAALNGKGDWLTSANLPANFTSLIISSSTGLVSSNATQINSIPTSSVTTINANVGTTQPINFTGSGSGALVNSSATVPGNVTIGGYAAGQDPGSYILRTAANKLNTDANGNVALAAAGLDAVQVESGIAPSGALLDDNGNPLTAINARQALALCQSLLAGILSGADKNTPLFQAVGKSTQVRLSGISDNSGNRTSAVVTLPS
jgi:hypothetical protein